MSAGTGIPSAMSKADARRPTIALISEVAASPIHQRQLRDAGFVLAKRFEVRPSASEDELADALRDAWGVVAGGEAYPGRLLDSLPGLRVIARPGAGYDAIDVGAATAHGVLVFATPGANTQAVADMTIALMLGCLLQIPAADRAVRSGEWRAGTVRRDLYGCTVGIIGLGRIGRAVVLRLRGFDCKLMGHDPVVDVAFCQEHRIEISSLDDLLRRSDVVTVHTPLSDETRGLLGPTQFALMKPGSVLVNTSRGRVVDEHALVEALREGRLSAAGLDVFATEPLPADHPLLTLENVVLTGHVASITPGAVANMMEAVVHGLMEARHRRAPVGSVNGEVVDAWPR